MAEIEYASKGVAGTGCHSNCCSENNMINRYELAQESRISKLESEIALRDANIYNDQKLLELYKYIDGKFETVNATLATQAVYNATQTATINCMQGQNWLFLTRVFAQAGVT